MLTLVPPQPVSTLGQEWKVSMESEMPSASLSTANAAAFSGTTGIEAPMAPALLRKGDGELPDAIHQPDLSKPPETEKLYTAAGVRLQRWMRFNPLRILTPENLSIAHDQFDIGILRQAVLYWDAMCRRDDTLSYVKPALENSISGKPWGIFTKPGADPVEAARHKAAVQYFLDNVTATDAFDRNERGGRWKLLKQMSEAHAYKYVVHHFVWEPKGEMIEVPPVKIGDGSSEMGDREVTPAPVPALTATLEKVPLQYFENVSGTLRFLPFGGFGMEGQPLDWDNEWMVTTGDGVMFAGAACYVFKRLTFQDWTIFNEKYSQLKPIGKTNAAQGTPAYEEMERLIREFNSDMGIVIGEWPGGSESPIDLLGPQGTVNIELFERFLDRQDRKLTVMFRGSDLRNMSRDKDVTGVSAQTDETEGLELSHCMNIADAGNVGFVRKVIRYCFGPDVEPLVYFGLPDMDEDNAAELRDSAGFLADRGAMVDLVDAAARLGVTLTEDPEKALTPVSGPAGEKEENGEDDLDGERSANAHGRKTQRRRDTEDEEDKRHLLRLRQLLEEALRTGNANPNHDAHGRFSSTYGSAEAEAAEIAKGKEAMEKVIKNKADHLEAMHRPGIGKIDFRWGNSGGGIRHIIEKRNREGRQRQGFEGQSGEDIARFMPEIIAKGKLSPPRTTSTGRKREIEHQGHLAILSLDFHRGDKRAWLLSGYRKTGGPR
jgi:hypothetical protein